MWPAQWIGYLPLDPGFSMHNDHELNLILVVNGSTSWPLDQLVCLPPGWILFCSGSLAPMKNGQLSVIVYVYCVYVPFVEWATFKNTIIICVCPPGFAYKHCFQFLLQLTMVLRENKNTAYSKFGGTHNEYYGIFPCCLFCRS